MSLVVAIIALVVAAFSTGINVILWVGRLLDRKKVAQISEQEKRRLEKEIAEEQKKLDAFKSYDGYEDFK